MQYIHWARAVLSLVWKRKWRASRENIFMSCYSTWTTSMIEGLLRTLKNTEAHLVSTRINGSCRKSKIRLKDSDDKRHFCWWYFCMRETIVCNESFPEVYALSHAKNPSPVLILHHLEAVNAFNDYCFWTKILGHEE